MALNAGAAPASLDRQSSILLIDELSDGSPKGYCPPVSWLKVRYPHY